MEPMTLAELGEPRYMEREAFVVAGLADEYTQATTIEIPKQWQRLDARATYGVVYATQPMRYVCGIDAAAVAHLPEGWLRDAVPAQRYAVFSGQGGIPMMRRMWPGLFQHWVPLHAGKLSDGPRIEFYPEKFGIGHDCFEIWLPLKV